MNKILEIKHCLNPKEIISNLVLEIYNVGPENPALLESLVYFKIFHPQAFSIYEEKLLATLGLFYKITSPSSLFSFLMAGFGKTSQEKFGKKLTPVQASIRMAIESSRYVSISAPTSSGKSYSIREYIFEQHGDAVIIVPSRALIAEYIKAVRDNFRNDKGVMVMPFADYVFSSREMRRIYILTPERMSDLFKIKDKLEVSVFFFDEAQISEEKSRGIVFDLTVRRVAAEFPNSKLVFAHPFVDNPEAQFEKHGLALDSSFYSSYKQHTVGKVFIHNHPSNGKDYFFSPYEENGHRVKECYEFEGGFRNFALSNQKTLLVYVSKSSIYNGKFVEGFSNHIEKLPVVTNPKALKIVSEITEKIGANNTDHFSKMVFLLSKGVVLHHGSIPLEVRLLLEEFIRKGFSSICFATSTLAQGINMPFDIVWLDSNRFLGDDKAQALAFKNLIGRSGRLTSETKYDFGYVYTNNAKLFSSKLKQNYCLDRQSVINTASFEDDTYIGTPLQDERELIESVRTGEYLTEYDMPATKLERLNTSECREYISAIIGILFAGASFKSSLVGEENSEKRKLLRGYFALIYEMYLGRQLLNGEKSVFNTALSIFFHFMAGRSFKEVVAIRYKNIINPRGGRYTLGFAQPANKLPNIYLNKSYSLFPKDADLNAVSYDLVVFDTYDYVDQVISFSLSNAFVVALESYSNFTGDDRAKKVVNFFKYGTDDRKSIMLLRYGFSTEEVKEIYSYIDKISEDDIVFNDGVSMATSDTKERIEWYLS